MVNTFRVSELSVLENVEIGGIVELCGLVGVDIIN